MPAERAAAVFRVMPDAGWPMTVERRDGALRREGGAEDCRARALNERLRDQMEEPALPDHAA